MQGCEEALPSKGSNSAAGESTQPDDSSGESATREVFAGVWSTLTASQQDNLCKAVRRNGAGAVYKKYPEFEAAGIGAFQFMDFTDAELAAVIGEPEQSFC